MIVGAGVVGCYLGSILGNQEIWELRKTRSEKACGGLYSKNIHKLKIPIEESTVNEVRGARIFSDNETFEIKRNTPQAYVVDKVRFQSVLEQQAVDSGCKIIRGKGWNGEKDDYVLGCDGAASSVASHLGIKKEFIRTYQIECVLNKKKDEDFVELHFGKFAPGFFGWLIPMSGEKVRIGLGCREGNAEQHFRNFVRKFDVKKTEKIQSAVIPVFNPKIKTVHNNVAVVGDAAGQVKASTGGGVIMGCLCAEKLKEAIDKKDLLSYEMLWRRGYQDNLSLHLKIHNFLRKTKSYDALFSIVREKNLLELIEEKGDMEDILDLRMELLKKPGLWRYMLRMLWS